MKKILFLMNIIAIFTAYSGNPIAVTQPSINFQRILNDALQMRASGNYRGAGRILHALGFDPSRISQETPSPAIVTRAQEELNDMIRLGQFRPSMLQDTEFDRLSRIG